MKDKEITDRLAKWEDQLRESSAPNSVKTRVLPLDHQEFSEATTVALIIESECNCGQCSSPVRFDYELIQEADDGQIQSVFMSRMMHQRLRITGLLKHGWSDGFDDPRHVQRLLQQAGENAHEQGG